MKTKGVKMTIKELDQAKKMILRAFNDYLKGKGDVPAMFSDNPQSYREFKVRSVIVGEFSRLKDKLKGKAQ